MKTDVLIFLLYAFSSNYADQKNNNAAIEFAAEEYDFGSLKPDAVAICKFNFINSGTAPLNIKNLATSCVCTVPDCPEKPIKPGEYSSITTYSDTSFKGVFNKKESVTMDKIH